MDYAKKPKDPGKETALWEAIRTLDRGNQRPVPDINGQIQQGGPSWHETDARKIMFLRHRYAGGEWQGEADRQPVTADSAPLALSSW